MLSSSKPQFLVKSDSAAYEELLKLCLHGKSAHTQRYYRRECDRFFTFVGKGPDRVTLRDVQAWADELAASELAANSQRRSLAAIKSFFTFGARLGVLKVNVAAPLRLPKVEDTLAERILLKSVVQGMIALEQNPRNRVLLKLLYGSAVRVSEASALKWRNLQHTAEGGQMTIYGKGKKTRSISLPLSLWTELMSFRGVAGLNDPVFRSRKLKGHLSPVQIWRVVKTAAKRVPGIDPELAVKVSTHRLRHAHASHALSRGASLDIVQKTLGHVALSTTGVYLHARPGKSSGDYLSL